MSDKRRFPTFRHPGPSWVRSGPLAPNAPRRRVAPGGNGVRPGLGGGSGAPVRSGPDSSSGPRASSGRGRGSRAEVRAGPRASAPLRFPVRSRRLARPFRGRRAAPGVRLASRGPGNAEDGRALRRPGEAGRARGPAGRQRSDAGADRAGGRPTDRARHAGGVRRARRRLPQAVDGRVPLGTREGVPGRRRVDPGGRPPRGLPARSAVARPALGPGGRPGAGGRRFPAEVWEAAGQRRNARCLSCSDAGGDRRRGTRPSCWCERRPDCSSPSSRRRRLRGSAFSTSNREVSTRSSPARLTVRHRTFQPDASADETLVIGWPEDAGAGAAVVRYRDPALPPDVVFFAGCRPPHDPPVGSGAHRLADRRDRVRGPRSPRAGRGRTRVSGDPFCRARGSRGFRRDETAARLDDPEPSGPVGLGDLSRGDPGRRTDRPHGARDRALVRERLGLLPLRVPGPVGVAAETFYRYTVWAVTDEGLLTRAFAAILGGRSKGPPATEAGRVSARRCAVASRAAPSRSRDGRTRS